MYQGSKTSRETYNASMRFIEHGLGGLTDRTVQFNNHVRPVYQHSKTRSNHNASYAEISNSQLSYCKKEYQESQVAWKRRSDSFEKREVKYLMRIAALEKESQRSGEQIVRMSKDNEALGRIPMLRKQIGELAKRLEQSHNENCSLRRQISFVSHTSSGVRNISTRASTITSMNTVTNSARRPKLDYVPSYMRALHLIP